MPKLPICLQIKDSIITDKKVIANKFNNFSTRSQQKLIPKLSRQKQTFKTHLKIQMRILFYTSNNKRN